MNISRQKHFNNHLFLTLNILEGKIITKSKHLILHWIAGNCESVTQCVLSSGSRLVKRLVEKDNKGNYDVLQVLCLCRDLMRGKSVSVFLRGSVSPLW